MGASVVAWEATGEALSRLLEEALPAFTWTLVAAFCMGGVAVSCYGLYAAGRHLLHGAPGRSGPGDGSPAPRFDDELVHREAARGIAALESWLGQSSPGSTGGDEAGSSAEG